MDINGLPVLRGGGPILASKLFSFSHFLYEKPQRCPGGTTILKSLSLVLSHPALVCVNEVSFITLLQATTGLSSFSCIARGNPKELPCHLSSIEEKAEFCPYDRKGLLGAIPHPYLLILLLNQFDRTQGESRLLNLVCHKYP